MFNCITWLPVVFRTHTPVLSPHLHWFKLTDVFFRSSCGNRVRCCHRGELHELWHHQSLTLQDLKFFLLLQTNNAVYEEIRDEGGQKGAAPVEISSVYALAKYNNTPETTDDYSVITAATPEHSVRKTLDRTKQNCNLGKVLCLGHFSFVSFILLTSTVCCDVSHLAASTRADLASWAKTNSQFAKLQNPWPCLH